MFQASCTMTSPGTLMIRALARATQIALGATLSLALLASLGCNSKMTTWSVQTKSENRRFSRPGQPAHYLVYRDSGARVDGGSHSKPAVILIHGLGGSKAVWRETVEELRGNYRVISIDLLGHGDSGKPADCDYRMSTQAELVEGLILELNLSQVALVGASYGGGVALELARRLSGGEASRGSASPGGHTARVWGLVLIDAAGLAFPPPPTQKLAKSRVLRWWVTNITSSGDIANILLRSAFRDRARISPELKAEYARCFDEKSCRVAIATAGRNMFDELRERETDSRRYANVGCPVMLLWGRHDRTIPIEVMSRLAERFPAARREVIEDCAHTPIEERPDLSIGLLSDFLAKCRVAED